MSETTDGTLLGGKIQYCQFKSGHRSGFEPVLLAAAVPARTGDLVLEAGTGAGAALLCLGHRTPGLTGIGLEIDPSLAALADENFRLNALDGFFTVVSDAAKPPFGPVFDHVFANPPWFDPAGTRSPDPARARAHHARANLLGDWISNLARCLKPRGSMTLILAAASLSEAVAVLRGNGFGAITIIPLWPRAGLPAKQVIISAIRHRQTPDQLLPGLILHDEMGITAQADEILRGGAALMTAAPYRAS